MFERKSYSKEITLVREKSDRTNKLNSLLIQDDAKNLDLLIDGNYPLSNIDELYSALPNPVCYFSHCHLDHTAHAYYIQENYDGTILCPEQEKGYLTSLKNIMDRVGFSELGLTESYKSLAEDYMKFKPCKKVSTFNPSQHIVELSNYTIEALHIPGHSPGHTAFAIKAKNSSDANVFYVSDIGSHPYYGDFNSNLPEYRNSIDKLEQIYHADTYILNPAHGKVYLEKEQDFFDRIRTKINKNGEKILAALSPSEPKSIRDLTYRWVLRSENRVNPLIKDLYLLWDGGMIYHHLQEFIAQGLVEKVDTSENIMDETYISVQ
ncbi:MAG: MBL fold metallo-hydrolase [Promethearchaeia archaeon]